MVARNKGGDKTYFVRGMIFSYVLSTPIRMKLKQLQTLKAIAETGSLQGAANQLAVTQPAVSRAVMELESELGVALLVRSAKGTSLTEAGSNVLSRARVIDREVRRIQEEAEARRGVFNGRLVVGVNPPAATVAFAETITAFADSRPDVQLNVIESRPQQIIAGLRDGSLDVAIFSLFGDQLESPHFDVELIYELSTTLAMSSRYHGPDRVTAKELRTMAWLVLDTTLDGSSFISNFFGAQGIPIPDRILRCSSVNMYAELARRLEVVSTWTQAGEHVLDAGILAGTMKRLIVEGGTPPAHLCLACPNIDLMTAIARDFVGWLRSALRKAGPTPGLSIGG